MAAEVPYDHHQLIRWHHIGDIAVDKKLSTFTPNRDMNEPYCRNKKLPLNEGFGLAPRLCTSRGFAQNHWIATF